MASGALGREVGKDLADDAGELVAVPRAWRGERDLRVPWVQVYDEVFVRRVCVHADVGREAPAGQRRDMLVQIPAHELDLLIAYLPVERFGGARHTTGSEEDSLHAALPLQKREAGERVSVVRFPDKDGKVAREKRFCATPGLEPVDNPPLGLQRKAQVREQCRGPGAGRDNQPFRLVCSHRRLHPNTVPGGRGFPGDNRLFETQFGSEGGRTFQMDIYGRLGPDEPRAPLVEGDGFAVGRQGWKAASYLFCFEQFVW